MGLEQQTVGNAKANPIGNAADGGLGVPDLSVIVVNYNTGHLLDRMISALSAAQDRFKIQLIIIDNASRDFSVDLLRSRYPEVELIANNINVGFGRANNQALPVIRGRFVLLLNTDAFVSVETLCKTIEYMDSIPLAGFSVSSSLVRMAPYSPAVAIFLRPGTTLLRRPGCNPSSHRPAWSMTCHGIIILFESVIGCLVVTI